MIKTRKGISPILATLLLVVIAVAAISVSYGWIMAYLDNTTDRAGVSLYEANTQFVSGYPNSVYLDIGNSGTANTTINGVYVGTSPATQNKYTPSWTTGPNVNTGQINHFLIMLYWNSSQTYYFKITTTSGQVLTFQQRAP